MTVELEEETKFAHDNIDSQEYLSKIESLENELHDLRDDLAQTEKEILQDKGYKPINIEEYTILVPVGMNLQQLRNSLKQMNPRESEKERAIKSLVSEEDKNSVKDHEDYQKIVERRREIVNEVNEVYMNFWEEEVKPLSATDSESISYMLAGLRKNIRSRKISDMTGIDERECRRYSYSDGVVTKKRIYS